MIRHAILAVVVSWVLCGLAVSCVSQSQTCTPADATMIAHGAECAARVHACADAVCKAAVRAECDAWGAARCAVPEADAGVAGAGGSGGSK